MLHGFFDVPLCSSHGSSSHHVGHICSCILVQSRTLVQCMRAVLLVLCSAAARSTELKTLQSVRLRTLVEPLVTRCAGLFGPGGVTERTLLVRRWKGARVDTRAPGGLEVLGRSVFPARPPVSSVWWSLCLLQSCCSVCVLAALHFVTHEQGK